MTHSIKTFIKTTLTLMTFSIMRFSKTTLTIMTSSKMTFSVITLYTMTLCIMTFNKTILSMKSFSTMTIDIMCSYAECRYCWLSFYADFHKYALYAECHQAVCHYAERRGAYKSWLLCLVTSKSISN